MSPTGSRGSAARAERSSGAAVPALGTEPPRLPPAEILARADHRPWPLPARPWVMSMSWLDLAFLHWPVSPAALAPLLPRGLEVDVRDGNAWIGVVPFRMSGVTPRLVPALPGLSAFCELNVRTYVRASGRPGVWFFSLDAASRLAVRVARAVFHLPYFDARMRSVVEAPSAVDEREPRDSETDRTIACASARTHRGAPPAELEVRYRAVGPVAPAAPGSLEAWLTERYALYAANRRGRLFRGEVHHAPWPLQPGEAELRRDTLTEGLGVVRPEIAPLVHVARRLDVLAWRLEPA